MSDLGNVARHQRVDGKQSRKYGHELSDYEFLWSNWSNHIKDRTWILIILISVAGHWWSTFRRHNKVQLLAFLCQWTFQGCRWKCLNYLMNQWDAEVAFLVLHILLKLLGNRSIDHNPHGYLSICQALPSKSSGQQRVLSSGGSFFFQQNQGELRIFVFAASGLQKTWDLRSDGTTGRPWQRIAFDPSEWNVTNIATVQEFLGLEWLEHASMICLDSRNTFLRLHRLVNEASCC